MIPAGIMSSRGAASSFVGVLDGLTSNLAAAYSFDRRLLGSYAGSGFRVTESGGSTATDIGFAGDGRFDQSALLTHSGANDALLDNLYDQSGNARHINYAAGSKFHVVQAGGWQSNNGRLMAKVLAAGGNYYTNLFTAYTGTTLSMYMVVVPQLTATNERFVSFVNPGPDYDVVGHMAVGQNNGNVVNPYRASHANTSINLNSNTPYTITLRSDGAVGTFTTADNYNVFSEHLNTSAYDIARFLLFGGDVNFGTSLVGNCVMELVIWFSDIGAAPLAAAAANAAAYYGTFGTMESKPSAGISIPDTSYVRPTSAVRYVATTGTNSGSGTLAAPWQTLAYAVANATAADTVIFRGGTYREGEISTGKNLTLQPYQHEQVWFTGADVVSGWVADGAQWRKDSWPRLFMDGGSPMGTTITAITLDQSGNHPLAGYPDQVWIDDVRLTQVASKALCTAGKFFIDYATTKGYIGDDPTGKTVEASTRAGLFNLEGGSGFTIKGLGVKRYGSGHAGVWVSAIRANEASVITERCSIVDNSYAGWVSFGSNCIVRDSKISYNGKSGVGTYQAHNFIMERCRCDFNNTEYFEPLWDAAGAKIVQTDNAIIRDCIFDDNLAGGLWLDINCRDNIITRNHFRRNLSTGITVELCMRTYVVSNWVSDTVEDLYSPAEGYGIYVYDSDGGWCYNNTLVNNAVDIVFADDENRDPDAAAIALSSTWDTVNWVVYNNVIVPKNSSPVAAVKTVSYTGGQAATTYFTSFDYQYYLLPASPGSILFTWQGSGSSTNYSTLAAFVAATIYEDNGISATAASLPAYTTGLTTTNGFQLSAGVATALNSGLLQPIYAAAVALPRGALHLSW